MTENMTFSVGINGHFNATVGNNGSGTPEGIPRSNIDYAVGFSSAALEVINVALTSQKLENSVDYLVYPICFNMRHAVELQLKKFWNDLKILSGYRKFRLDSHRNSKIKADPELRGRLEAFPSLDEASTHDLRKIWNLIEEYAPLIDSRFNQFIELLSPFIADLADMDATGQTFRYPANNESQIHLEDTPIISIEILKVRFTNLIEILKHLEDVSNEMIYEYSWSDFTNNLSHFDVIQATKHLATFLGGELPYYKAAKGSTQKEFNLSANEYSKLVKIIDNDKTINYILETDNQPEYLNFDSLVAFFDILDQVYPMTEYVDSYHKTTSSHFDISTAFGEHEIKRMVAKSKAIEDVSQNITLYQIAEIYALYEYHKQPCYIQIFERYLKEFIDELKVYEKRPHTNETHEFIRHFFEKTNLIRGVLSSLWTFNMRPLVKELVHKYNLSSVPWYTKLEGGEVRDGLTEYNRFYREIKRLRLVTEESNKAIRRLSSFD
ncbi:transcriptional regulator [Vibrio sp. Of14-4]|uniref:transcriptional regulator n=1 Tax=Vibrio sp. Of14-4 TaxID=2724878 RepID=UPI001EF1AA27|nr:transcriptional regulator [Vibrio sp. Of14-4]MCG7488670.1 transcriptional regulator [Vibrio sp. Of14-4]